MGLEKYSKQHILAFLDSIYLAGATVSEAAAQFGLSQGYACQVALGRERQLPEYKGLYSADRRKARPGRKPFKNLDVEKLRAMYAAGGWTHAELAKQFGCSRETVGAALDGTPLKGKKRPRLTEAEIERMLKRERQGISVYQIAKELDRSQTTIARYLRQCGLRA